MKRRGNGREEEVGILFTFWILMESLVIVGVSMLSPLFCWFTVAIFGTKINFRSDKESEGGYGIRDKKGCQIEDKVESMKGGGTKDRGQRIRVEGRGNKKRIQTERIQAEDKGGGDKE
jgi:hypothetical protein